jgi:heat shock protein HslJ
VVSRLVLGLISIALALGFIGGGAAYADEPPVPSGGDPAAMLVGKRWMLQQMVGADGSVTPVIPGTEIIAEFRDGRIMGSAGCNSYGGAYVVREGAAISISDTFSTLMACLRPGLMEQESAYLAALRGVSSFEVTADVLSLRSGDGAMLRFVPQPQVTLEGTDWVATGYNTGRGAVSSLAIGSPITARFESGNLTGSAGCNMYSARYTVDGNRLTIGDVASTRRACAAPGVMEQEAAYLAALGTVRAYRTQGTSLILQTSDGAAAATFSVAPVGRSLLAPADVTSTEDALPRGSAQSSARGRVRVKVVPLLSVESTAIVPPWAPTISLAR